MENLEILRVSTCGSWLPYRQNVGVGSL